MSVGILPPAHLYPLSVKQYRRMIESGALTEDDPVELLEGLLVTKLPEGPPHDGTLTFLGDLIRELLPRESWVVRTQCSITLSKSEPEPDLVVAVGPPDKYLSRHPLAADIALVIEAAESSLERDRNLKGPIYAKANLPEYWIVNLVDRVVEVYTQPRGGRRSGYQTINTFERGNKIPLKLLEKLLGELPVKRFLREPS